MEEEEGKEEAEEEEGSDYYHLLNVLHLVLLCDQSFTPTLCQFMRLYLPQHLKICSKV